MKYGLINIRLIFMVVLFIVLKDDNINQSIYGLVKFDSKRSFLLFYQNTVDLINCSKVNK